MSASRMNLHNNAEVVQQEQPANQREDGGLMPAPPLHLCVFCSARFASRGELKQHKRDQHMEKLILASRPHVTEKQEWKEYLNPSAWHPAANLMPMCDRDDFAQLVADIKTNGLKIPVVLLGNQVLDGRNRLKACQEAGVVPTFISLEADENFDAVSWVISTNMSRRHLTKSQIACVLVEASELVERLAAEAKSRQGTRSDIVGVVPPSSPGKTRDKLGELGGVSGRYISDAAALKKQNPEVFEKVKSGGLSLSEVMSGNSSAGHPSVKAKFNPNHKPPAPPATPNPVAQLFMRSDRLLPQNDSFFCEGADSPERSFPQLIEDAIQQVPTAGDGFTIEYRTFANVKSHEALVDGKITHQFPIDDLAQVLDAVAAYCADAAARVRKAAAGETVPPAVQRKRKWQTATCPAEAQKPDDWSTWHDTPAIPLPVPSGNTTPLKNRIRATVGFDNKDIPTPDADFVNAVNTRQVTAGDVIFCLRGKYIPQVFAVKKLTPQRMSVGGVGQSGFPIVGDCFLRCWNIRAIRFATQDDLQLVADYEAAESAKSKREVSR